jgi:hypothetical protein
LELILDLDSIGGRAHGLNPAALKKMFDELDEYTKEILLLNARVWKNKPKQAHRGTT